MCSQASRFTRLEGLLSGPLSLPSGHLCPAPTPHLEQLSGEVATFVEAFQVTNEVSAGHALPNVLMEGTEACQLWGGQGGAVLRLPGLEVSGRGFPVSLPPTPPLTWPWRSVLSSMRAQVSVCAPSRGELTFSLGCLPRGLPTAPFLFLPVHALPPLGPSLVHSHTFVSPGPHWQTPLEQRPLSSSKSLRKDLFLFLGHPA